MRILVAALYAFGLARADNAMTVEFASFTPEQVADDDAYEMVDSLLVRYAVRPEDDPAQRIGALAAHAARLGVNFTPAELDRLAAEVRRQREVEAATDRQRLAFQPTYAAHGQLADVPFSFERLRSGGGDPSAAADLVQHVRRSIANARAGLSRLLATKGVLEVSGMSDARVRHLLNNIVAAPGARFVEVRLSQAPAPLVKP